MLLLFKACTDSTAEVRQSSFALLGELAKVVFPFVEPCLGQFMPVLSQNLDIKYISVCNNSTWAIGEIAVKHKENIQGYVHSILPQLIHNLNQQDAAKTLMENTGKPFVVSLGFFAFKLLISLFSHHSWSYWSGGAQRSCAISFTISSAMVHHNAKYS